MSAQSQAQLALDLLRIAADPDSNAFLSPISIAIALAMTYAGADGNTRKQMNEQLFGGHADDKIHAFFSTIVDSLSTPVDGYQLHSANRLYVQADYHVLPEYTKTLANHYKNAPHPVDFANNATAIASDINRWVEQVTHDRIKNLIEPGILNALTRLVLVNAVYFKGDWCDQFNKRDTRPMPFYSSANQQKEVQMMHINRKFQYTENDHVQVLGLPYKGRTVSMYIFLPKERFGLNALEKSLNGKSLLQLINDTYETKVEVTFPKFKLESQFELSAALRKLGVDELFDEQKANLANISGNRDLHVSAIIHKAFIEVNEEGSEAAAATAVSMGLRCMPMPDAPPITFVADHPFLFTIVMHHNEQQQLLFIGRHA